MDTWIQRVFIQKSNSLELVQIKLLLVWAIAWGVNSSLETEMTCKGHYEMKLSIYKKILEGKKYMY